MTFKKKTVDLLVLPSVFGSSRLANEETGSLSSLSPSLKSRQTSSPYQWSCFSDLLYGLRLKKIGQGETKRHSQEITGRKQKE